MTYDLRDCEIVHHGVKGQKWGIRRALTSTGHIVGSKYGSDKPVTNRQIRKAEKNLKKANQELDIARVRVQIREMNGLPADARLTNDFVEKMNKALAASKKTGELAEKRKQETAKNTTKNTTPLGTAIDNLAVKQKRVKELQERANKQVDNRANNDTKVKGDIEKELWKAMAEQIEAEDAVVNMLQSIKGV